MSPSGSREVCFRAQSKRVSRFTAAFRTPLRRWAISAGAPPSVQRSGTASAWPTSTDGHACNPMRRLQTCLLPSEDCLYLNVWTPAARANDRLPVMVWIHGGGFTAGTPAEQLYHGEWVAAKGVIVVSVGYR